jgi:hypothetical protein
VVVPHSMSIPAFFSDTAAQEKMMATPLFIRQTMPGSLGEHDLQERYGTRSRVEAFCKHQVLS